ncbi:MAG: ABC transporter permease [Pseudobutyrivibrio sp.]|nr:ABC transporter permease [Pseudobutyrivibrio sp.]
MENDMIRYFLLLKRLIKKKSYIAMLLVVPIMVSLLLAMSRQESGVLTIGVYSGDNVGPAAELCDDLQSRPGSLNFIFYNDEDQAIADVKNQTLTEAWIIPENFGKSIQQMAEHGQTRNKIQVVIRESGISHMLAKEVLCSRVYPLVALQMAMDYIDKNVYDGEATQQQLAHAKDIFDGYEINGDLFEMGYIDGSESQDSDSSYLLMPLRGILALWLLLCAIAASMYYLEDEKNGLFIWWKPRVKVMKNRFGSVQLFFMEMLRDLLYYVTIIFVPTIVVLLGLWYGGTFTTLGREIIAIILYDFAAIVFSIILRELIRGIRGLGIITPILILASAVFTPVFIDIKEVRELRRIFPTFYYLYCIHDGYYLKFITIFVAILLVAWTSIRLTKKLISK